MTPNLEQPKTIEELRNWFKANGYEPARTRFFAGVDVKSPKAFGIYKNEFGEFVVYKNKADGTRAIRYQGDDEEFAVHELYQRFQEEIINQQTRWTAGNQKSSSYTGFYSEEREHKATGREILLAIIAIVLSFILTFVFLKRYQANTGKDLQVLILYIPLAVMGLTMLACKSFLRGSSPLRDILSLPQKSKIRLAIFAVIIAIMIAVFSAGGRSGYYSIGNSLYYRAGNDWYYYDDDRFWTPAYNIPSSFTDSGWKDYRTTENYQGYYLPFENTDYYEEWHADYDSSSSGGWDHDDWDSGYTDWNSDW